MTDIVERLRGYGGNGNPLADEAADEILRLRVLVNDLADDLAAEVEGHYHGVKDHPAMRPKYERDMENVYRARRVSERK